jgi:hypothetical protein
MDLFPNIGLAVWQELNWPPKIKAQEEQFIITKRNKPIEISFLNKVILQIKKRIPDYKNT